MWDISRVLRHCDVAAFELTDEELGVATEVILASDVNSFEEDEIEYDRNGTT